MPSSSQQHPRITHAPRCLFSHSAFASPWPRLFQRCVLLPVRWGWRELVKAVSLPQRWSQLQIQSLRPHLGPQLYLAVMSRVSDQVCQLITHNRYSRLSSFSLISLPILLTLHRKIISRHKLNSYRLTFITSHKHFYFQTHHCHPLSNFYGHDVLSGIYG